jgi:hypothetical protein
MVRARVRARHLIGRERAPDACRPLPEPRHCLREPPGRYAAGLVPVPAQKAGLFRFAAEPGLVLSGKQQALLGGFSEHLPSLLYGGLRAAGPLRPEVSGASVIRLTGRARRRRGRDRKDGVAAGVEVACASVVRLTGRVRRGCGRRSRLNGPGCRRADHGRNHGDRGGDQGDPGWE